MATVEPTYNVDITCPACEVPFQMTKVRTKMVRYTGQDTDLCPMYVGPNPLFYDAIVCPNCGFANIGTSFENLNTFDFNVIKEKITSKWVKRDFTGPRTVEQAIGAYKIVQLNVMSRAAPPSEMAKICLRLAWMNRIRGDTVTEFKFLESAFQYYSKTYTQEHLPVGKLDEFTLMYMLGELGRRIGKYTDSIAWFGRLLSAGTVPENKECMPANLLEMGRNQEQLVKDEMKEDKAQRIRTEDALKKAQE